MAERMLFKIVVKGRVQGVGFRWSAASEAMNLGISGIVRNLSDGSVYIEAEGTRDQLELFTGWCRRGPRLSRVDSVDIVTSVPFGYDDFKIDH